MPPEQAADEAEAHLEQGFRAVKLRLGRPTAEQDLAVVRAVRRRLPDNVALMVDYNQALTVTEAIRRGQAMHGEGLFWIEEPIRHDDYAGCARIAEALATPVQIGENFAGPPAMAAALAAGACDYVMPDFERIGGVTGWQRAAAIASAVGIEMSSHIFPEVSAQLLAATPTCHFLEYVDCAAPILAEPLRIVDAWPRCRTGRVRACPGTRTLSNVTALHEAPMSDPVPAITEAAATGETAAILADIRQVLGVDVVNLIWRHLAITDGALQWAWQAIRPLYADGSVIGQATALRRDLALPPMPSIQVEVYPALGLRPGDMAAIRGVLSAYDHTNGMAVVALTALRGRLDGRVPGNMKPAEPTPLVAVPWIGLPKLLDLTAMQPETAALVAVLNGLGTRRPGAVLASMYRHLAHWPPYLAFAWLLLAPMDDDGRLAAAIDQAQSAVQSHADGLLVRLIDQADPPPPALATWISTAVEPCVGDVIVKMLVICAFPRRVTV